MYGEFDFSILGGINSEDTIQQYIEGYTMNDDIYAFLKSVGKANWALIEEEEWHEQSGLTLIPFAAIDFIETIEKGVNNPELDFETIKEYINYHLNPN